MAALGMLFFEIVFADQIAPQDAGQYIAGLILLGITDPEVPWETLLLSVVLYVVIPLVAGTMTRAVLLGRGGGGCRTTWRRAAR